MVIDIVISTVLLIVGIVALVMIHICIVGRLFRVENQDGASVLDSSSAQRIIGSTPKMSTEDLGRLPCFDYVVEGGRINHSDCAVCLDSFKCGEKCKSLPDCGHYFHAQCIDSWLLKTPICPVCRAVLNFPEIRKESLMEGDVTTVVAN